MSANTLTNLIPTIMAALDTVSREQIGFIPAVFKNTSLEKAAKGETVRYPVVPAIAAANITAAATGPNPSGVTIGSDTMSLDKARAVTFPWNGEEEKGMANGGIFDTVLQDEFAQAFRTLTNEIEADLAALYKYASRAYGTAGTTPFASTVADTAQMLKILKDNGSPMSDLHLVIDTTAGAKLRTLTQVTKANEAASDATLRRGTLLDMHGFAIHESGEIDSHTKGTGTSYQSANAAGYSVGDTNITIDTGSGTVLAGDVVTFAGDTNKYIVATGVSAPGTIVLAAPGLRETLADNVAMTIGGSSTENMAFHRKAIHLVTRVPAVPSGGDSAADSTVIQDPISGIGFRVAKYLQYHQVSYEVSAVWGTKAAKPEHMGNLLG